MYVTPTQLTEMHAHTNATQMIHNHVLKSEPWEPIIVYNNSGSKSTQM